jgi:hypothetical protein
MAEKIEQYSSLIEDESGVSYLVEACGDTNASGLWEGWLEFYPLGSENQCCVLNERLRNQTERPWSTGRLD